ncbi:17.3 kDa class II heat shock protein-like [Ipomoea triloba]|uniref:17.3 kDa class II heat shock protein-like n=1 Tax=Ipomoea triloba TaxID=35885 RepID=UPI00125D0F2B|nr:17.3 kDa class II heat shock protein-like [Ipomoea triloba]
MDFALRDLGFDAPMIAAIHDAFDFGDESEHTRHHRAYIQDSKAMKATAADVMEYPNAYYFVVDMPGLKRDQIKVHLEDGNVLVISGERRREEKEKQQQPQQAEGGVKFLRMERRLGKLLKKFVLPENANTDAISAALEDGVLTVSVEKRPPPEPKKPKVIEVSIGQHGGDAAGGGRNGSERGQIRDGKHK